MYEEKYLVFVSENNNNKFYHMKRNGNTFTATWGRVGTAGQCKSYPISQWDKKLQEKLAKGYTDQSDLHRVVEVKKETEYKAIKSGWAAKIEAEEIGKAAMVLGAGRATKEDVIDHSVGIVLKKKVGDYVEAGETLAVIQHNDKNLDSSIKFLDGAYTISDNEVEKHKVILEIHSNIKL